ncbi:isochorismate synthase [Rhodococcus sp. Z13]|uniref:Isochorismate synthase n=1 Tax=Rhodococcus sacchari TaxID=2962047 RepID=A0ACD4DHV2_9NOCA|nr:isochorismate synthase [Rhodococcus sp. Z13]UYP19563.1 isochorismate synthase [Rhodococcus sp. Z13]
MRVPVVAPAGDRAERSVARPFVLSRPHGTVAAEGIDQRFDSASAAADALRSGRVTALTGALPFAPGHPAALTAPHALRHSPAPLETPRPSLPPIRISTALPSEAEHVDRVATALRLLRSDDSDLLKVVLARALVLDAERPVGADDLLAALTRNDPLGNGFAVDLTPAGDVWAGRHLVGSSPEVLVRRQGDRVTAHPLAGSAPRHPDPEVDRATGERLAASAKNLAEHAHVVDALRAALEPLCTDLEIPDRPSLTSTRQLWHLGTPVAGRLRDPGTTALDLALAVHPTPAICGTPTAAARDLILDLEGDRGFYAGALGWCDADGDGEWMVTIRCAVLEPDGVTLTAYAGGGIVAASDPADELAETTVKFGTVLEALGVHS